MIFYLFLVNKNHTFFSFKRTHRFLSCDRRLFLSHSPTCLFNLSAPCHKTLYNTWHSVVIVKKNGMDCLFSLSCIHLSSSFILHSFIFICLFVCSLVSINEAPWRCLAFQSARKAASHTLFSPSLSCCLSLFIPWMTWWVKCQWRPVMASERRTSRCKLDGNSGF